MRRRVIAIGDIHGCLPALEAVLGDIRPRPDDRIVTLGDYIDRGPDSRGVIDRLLQLQAECELIPLIGNHEIMLLAAHADESNLWSWLSCGGRQCLESYGGSLDDIPATHLDFIRTCRRYYETPTHFFIHANYAPDLPLDLQPDYLAFWEHIAVSDYPRQGRPLYVSPGPHENGKIAVVGHTPQPCSEPLVLEHLICLDTGCFARGCLTAMDIDTGDKWRADKFGRPVF